MNRRVIRLTLALAAGFAVLLVQLTNIGFVRAGELRRHELNTRAAAAAIGNARGGIASVDGETLAPSISPGDRNGAPVLRTYPHGPLYAHIVGYLGPEAGASGVERSYDSELSGTTTGIAVRELTDLFADSGRVGDIVLTLNHGVQLTARAALGDRDGAIVVIDPATGAVVAMWSRPSLDPGALVSLGPDADGADAGLPSARAYQRHYALGVSESLSRAGVDLLEGARQEPGSTSIDLPSEPDGADPNDPGMGDGDVERVRLTPLQLALAAASLANDGIRMRPHVVHRVDIRSNEGEASAPDASVESTPREAGRLFSPADAAALLARMIAEARQSSISLESADGVELAAASAVGWLGEATGDRARMGGWAVLLAPADAPTVAVAVLIEPDATLDIGDPRGGGTLATMIAATAAEAALALRAVPQPDRP
ncbi:penicillin-binding transpeptidase domain-containing protein [Candidatus Poriferisodalis sp.]|uniref:penicillin-binding transpeptidase domain-containing protein n=1 Tax=Candidatus Poriferisodalis sp. TaxID=3101277 RepID=UPI003B020540